MMYGDFEIIRGSYNDFLVVIGNNDIEMSRKKQGPQTMEALEIRHKRLDYFGASPFYVGFLTCLMSGSVGFFLVFKTGGFRGIATFAKIHTHFFQQR